MSKELDFNQEQVEVEDLLKKIDQLEERLAWYKSFFDNATDAVFIVQPDTWNILDANEYAANLLDTPRFNLIGSKMPQFSTIFKLLKKSDSPVVLSELTFEISKNKKLMVEISARCFKHEDSEIIYAIARDVTEQHALTDKMVQADKMVLLGQLSAGVAHEIRNPLAAVNLNLQLIKRNLKEDDKNLNYVNTAMQGSDRISRIVDLTLNFSKPTIPKVERININRLIPNSLDLVKPALKSKNIDITLNLEENLPDIEADAKQIQQVLINLLTNAFDSIKNHGKVEVNTYIEESSKNNERRYVVTSIQDSGIGISNEDLQRIFNPFFTRKTEGTGLGLPITQRILHHHNGVIDVESSKDKGTCFYVKLPIV